MTTIDFSATGSFQGSEYKLGGVTITGSGDVVDTNTPFSGIGIVGGASVYGPDTLDAGETIIFSFDAGAVTNVSFQNLRTYSNNDRTVETTVEAFGTNGTSLGAITIDLGLADAINVSALYNGVPISKVQLTPQPVDGFTIRRLTFNQLPTANEDTFSIAKNQTVDLDVLGNDSDPDTDPLTITSVSNLAASVGILTNNGGSISFDPASAFSGGATFEYTISDGKGGTDTAQVTVNVGTNQMGGNGKDTLTGNAGKDVLNGGNGADTLIGGLGDDTLTGGNGPDRFVLGPKDGTDTITDFQVGTDLIVLSGGLTFNALTRSGNNILVGGEVLATLTGVNTSTLNAANFTTA